MITKYRHAKFDQHPDVAEHRLNKTFLMDTNKYKKPLSSMSVTDDMYVTVKTKVSRPEGHKPKKNQTHHLHAVV